MGAGVRPLVGLTLLEALRDLDLPSETFEDEDVNATMPRRFGVSRVMAVQIRRYEEAVKARRRMDEEELVHLLRLVTRRPDSEEIFELAGERLAGSFHETRRWHRLLPLRLRRRFAIRDLRRRLRDLFGLPFVPVTADRLALEAREDLLVRGDPGGEACMLVQGFLRTAARRHLPDVRDALHSECMALGASRCRWRVAFGDDVPPSGQGGDGGETATDESEAAP